MKFNKIEDLDTFHWKRIKRAELAGKYDMPVLQPIHDVTPENLVPFHLAKTTKNAERKWFHFYEDDYQFERIWNRPEQYLPMLKKFAGGIGTDFSIYLDMPRAQQIWNCWRNRAMTYQLQQSGMRIIPNVGWSDTESLEWAFDGIPENSVLAVTSQGCMGHDYVCKQSFLNGLHELVRQKHPEIIFVYGRFPEEWKKRFPVPIITLHTFSEERWGEKNG